ncbi:lysine--tRNA ligase [Cytobacillus purgationiresistens]|uniref:Lysine--tRNA ligase n=1 Tax=Cytobacillus purgationiresistens TaxID=863449 RepID=A0ABU0AA90_9BACI|nr:lysine--tRNA ligase [Cytobacillus purgationiresistens]MDQ0268163.1 lysyl-tRNA synthetase class 1 [Cytobacillus purgationiresistens]
MHWAFEIAEELIKKYPNNKVFTCASGISPSGSVHIGNFREVITTYFVTKALQALGKETRFIFSWDDYDRLRKVPANVDASYEDFVGMPYADIPSPNGEGSYARYFEKEFEESLRSFQICPEFSYQADEYRSGRYASKIKRALIRRKDIYDILQRFKTSEPSERDREAFYPITLYCEACNRDSTRIHSYNEEELLEYNCSCGYEGKQSLFSDNRIKLNWKVDWAMRWSFEDVVFEPGGRDHSAATGSYNVSKVIAREIFDYEAPDYVAYDFITLKGTNEKMSSSSGNVMTPKDLLKIYTPEVILFMFAKYKPNASFHIGLDEDVQRAYSEFERYYQSYCAGKLNHELLIQSLELAGVNQCQKQPSFQQVAGIYPLVNFNEQALQTALSKSGEWYTTEELATICNRAEYWLRYWKTDTLIKVNEDQNISYYRTLSSEDKNRIEQVVIILKNESGLMGEQLMKRIYAICHEEDKKKMKQNQRNLFKNVYQLLINEESGPRLPLLFSAIGTERVIRLLVQ